MFTSLIDLYSTSKEHIQGIQEKYIIIYPHGVPKAFGVHFPRNLM